MLDDFREQASSSVFIDEEEETSRKARSEHRERYFLGMSPAQRFVIALLLLLITCVLGTFSLLVTERIFLPFL
jgi:hypothetical protein